jgi:hypothetical protein
MFRRMICKTYGEYHPMEFSRKHWNDEELMKVVVD